MFWERRERSVRFRLILTQWSQDGVLNGSASKQNAVTSENFRFYRRKLLKDRLVFRRHHSARKIIYDLWRRDDTVIWENLLLDSSLVHDAAYLSTFRSTWNVIFMELIF